MKNNRDQNQADLGQWEQQWTDGLQKMEQWFPPAAPDLHSFERLVAEQKMRQRRLFIRDLSIFGAVAVTAITAGLFGLSQIPVVYGIAQLGALVGFPLWFAFQRTKRENPL